MGTSGTDTVDLAAVEAILGPQLTAEQAEAIIAQGHDAVLFALLTLAERLADTQVASSAAVDPSTPSGQTPPYKKPPAKARAKRKGAVTGHLGSRRGSTAPKAIRSRCVRSATAR